MGIKAMGFEGQVFYGAAGSTAATQVLNSKDIKITPDPQMGDTTVRGPGVSPPIESESVSSIKWSMTMNMLNDKSDPVVESLKVANAAGGIVAIRMKDFAGGKGYNGDCNVKAEQGIPLKGEQTVDFTFTPNNNLRTPQIYV